MLPSSFDTTFRPPLPFVRLSSLPTHFLRTLLHRARSRLSPPAHTMVRMKVKLSGVDKRDCTRGSGFTYVDPSLLGSEPSSKLLFHLFAAIVWRRGRGRSFRGAARSRSTASSKDWLRMTRKWDAHAHPCDQRFGAARRCRPQPGISPSTSAQSLGDLCAAVSARLRGGMPGVRDRSQSWSQGLEQSRQLRWWHSCRVEKAACPPNRPPPPH